MVAHLSMSELDVGGTKGISPGLAHRLSPEEQWPEQAVQPGEEKTRKSSVCRCLKGFHSEGR